MCESSHYLGL